MAASRSRRVNAGALMAGLMKDFKEEETYKTLYGGFEEEVNDDEFDVEKASDEESDVEIESEEEDLEDDVEEKGDEEEEGRRRRTKKPVAGMKRKAPQSASMSTAKKPKRRVEELVIQDTDSRSPALSGASENGTPQSSGRRSIRDSTAAKRYITAELEQARALRREELGPRQKVQYRIPTQKERLARCKETEKLNTADLEKYQKDEEENEKKRGRKIRRDRGSFDIRFVSSTARVPESTDGMDPYDRKIVEESQKVLNLKPGDRFTCSAISFRQESLFDQIFPASTKSIKPADRVCCITGKKAHYKDPVTGWYYSDLPSYRVLHSALYQHFTGKPTLLNNSSVMDYLKWCESKFKFERPADIAKILSYDYSLNAVK